MLGSTLWLGITEPDSEIIKEETLLGFKDNIIDGDILLTTEGSINFIFDGIEEFHSDGNSSGVPAETYDVETLSPIDITFLVVADPSKLGN